MKLLKIIFFTALIFPSLVFANQLSESFSSRTNLSSSTGIWNQARGLLTPNLVIRNWNDGANHTSDFEIGDGSHGAFNASTWSSFATSVDTVGKIIYLNTTSYPIFKFTTFDLPTGWTMEPVGSNPLIIYVQGDMTITGTIECSGKHGTSSTGTGGTAVAGVGGDGRCGGGAGGNGGAVYAGGVTGDGGDGSSPSVTIGGGTRGRITGAGTGSGGGGGGAWSGFNIPGLASTAGTSGVAGPRGTNSSDPGWANVLGSAGGGGGSGSTNEAGGGGGGGGGIVIIHVGGNFTLEAAGFILANGGNGGISPSAGGGGGAGGGGSIQIWVAENMTLNGPGNNQISAASGTRGNAATGGDGGSGWAGRTWIGVEGTKFSNPFGATNDPPSELTAEGTPEYLTTAVTAISNPLDTLSTLASFSSAGFSTSGTSSEIQLEVAGSNDAFASDDTGWVSSTNVAQVDNKRYVRFRVTLSNTNVTTPTTVDSITFNFTAGEKKDFEFQATGCGLTQSQGPGSGGFMVLLFLFPIGLCLVFRFRNSSSTASA